MICSGILFTGLRVTPQPETIAETATTSNSLVAFQPETGLGSVLDGLSGRSFIVQQMIEQNWPELALVLSWATFASFLFSDNLSMKWSVGQVDRLAQ
jgi:hypothetical protein